ncbi:MAG: hypothetical protein Kow0042_07210 [Calditrichia bacterium]
MYEDIRKPTMLKHVPMVFIRALPVIYYYGKFAKEQIPDKARSLFATHLEYLVTALRMVGEQLKNSDFIQLADGFKQCELKPIPELLGEVETQTLRLSELCTANPNEIQNVVKTLRESILNWYLENVNRLSVLVTDIQSKSAATDKIISQLKNFCYYNVEQTLADSLEYPKKLVDHDFILFTSIDSPKIHELVQSLKAYRKPGLALAQVKKGEEIDNQIIRHGAQLMRNNFQVLFKVFTPIRLFTTVDKIYMHHQLTGN